MSEVEVQLHVWPWSAGNPKRWPEDERGETVDLVRGDLRFPFYGSPVLSISSQVALYLPKRHERFSAFGPPFKTPSGLYQLYEAPHGVLTGVQGEDDPFGYISLQSAQGRSRIQLKSIGAIPRLVKHNGDHAKATRLYGTVLSWSQQFETLLEAGAKKKGENKISWDPILDHFLMGVDRIGEPRMALIVQIAEEMARKVVFVVNAARKILLRERQMVPAHRVAELDTRCLRWLGRQAGETLAQKAAINKQRLLGVVRHESFDTLENRVLKDFLVRSANAGSRYLDIEVAENPVFKNSSRAKKVRGFRHICSLLSQAKHLEAVQAPTMGLRPNYVLQNDFRYRQIWHYYLSLLRREEEQDRLWDWQSRTWADVVRTMVYLAIYKKSKETALNVNGSFEVKEILSSTAHLLTEQHLGCRVNPGCEPGPFVIRSQAVNTTKSAILEMVHPDQACHHSATQGLGLLGGHLYLVLTPLSSGKTTVIVVWAVHTAGAMEHPCWSDIGLSAGAALQRQELFLGRNLNAPLMRGFIAASDLEEQDADLIQGVNGGLHLVRVAADPRSWPDAMAGMELALEDVLRESL